MDLHGLVGVAEHGDGGEFRDGFLSAGEGARFAIGLQSGRHFLGHLLKIGRIVERDGIPKPNRPILLVARL